MLGTISGTPYWDGDTIGIMGSGEGMISYVVLEALEFVAEYVEYGDTLELAWYSLVVAVVSVECGRDIAAEVDEVSVL